MVFAKHKSEPAPESAAELIARLGRTPIAGDDLNSLIHLVHGLIAKDLQERVGEMKKSPSYRDLPIGVLEAELVKNRCSCFAALSWLGQ